MLAIVSVSIQMVAATLGSSAVLASGFQARGSQSPTDGLARVEVPYGAQACPNSGLGASCSFGAAAAADAGVASLPAGLVACLSDETKPTFDAPGACSADPSASPSVESAAGSASAVPTPATSTTPDAIGRGLSPVQLDLSSDKTRLAAGDPVLLSVSTVINVSLTPWTIEVFDQTTRSLVGACAQANSCQVSFTAKAGSHAFIAFLAVPSATIPVQGIRLQSEQLNVQWLAVTLAASNPSVVGPGKAVTFTATASDEVSKIGYQIELNDTTTGQRLTYCSQGTSCSTSLIEPGAGTHVVVADLILTPVTFGRQPVLEKSAPVSATWLSVGLTASAYSLQGGTTLVTATANADLTGTPWATFIFKSPGQPIGSACASATCTAGVVLPAGASPSFYAVVARRDSAAKGSGSLSSVLGQLQTSSMLSDIQARSAVVTPFRMMWGVDSCAAFTQDAAGSTGLLPQVISRLGAPDFWARYLPTTGNCAGLSTTEVAAARSHHMGILPIYNDYDCSAVVGHAAGAAYAARAVQIAIADLIPLGTGIAIDIEPPGDWCPGAANVDGGFITGWFDGITAAGYAPVYYGNTTAGSEFGQAWCASVAQQPEIATSSYLWSFEPDLLGSFTKASAPGFSPSYAGCAGQYVAWQYRISDGSTPDVDHDEATSQLPMWYP